ncbi:hypothetical protein T265_09851 [Opisthorchis viverrini]|uniref:Uncharacterized protein n=1 Tax=Opisthorchis viverrini TaxID=6198 RepID=A0A075A3H3_OPIVI|nr:hypothetical protein T265_09851 [Opisthorchis viverrini]KER21954.1 hypothetical protein T265_09851 [Opisthorchis viverrini]
MCTRLRFFRLSLIYEVSLDVDFPSSVILSCMQLEGGSLEPQSISVYCDDGVVILVWCCVTNPRSSTSCCSCWCFPANTSLRLSSTAIVFEPTMCTSCASCIRFLMIIFNIVFTVIGLVLLGAGLYFHFSSFGFRGMENHNFLAYTFILIITVGALSVVLGILGCCGSYHYSRCLLGFYFALLLIIFAAEIAVGVAGFVYRDQAQQLVHLTLKAGVEDIKLHRGEIRWMDTIQIMFQCCGYDNQLDYGILHYVPNTCCPNQQCSIGNSIFPYFPVSHWPLGHRCIERLEPRNNCPLG